MKSVPLKISGLFTVLSTCSLSFIVSFLAYLPGLILLQMSPLTLIKLFLGSVFKPRGFEEEEHLCAINESRAEWVGLEVVLPGASILKKDKRLTFPWWQHRFGCLQQGVLSFWTGTPLNSKNHLLTPTCESFIRSNLYSVVLFSCSL